MSTFLFHAWLASLIVFALAIGLGTLLRRGGDLTLRQLHHAYLSVPLFLVGLLFGWGWLQIIGVFLAFDDAEEHVIQLAAGPVTYQSPAHLLWYATLGSRWPFTALNRWADRLLHGAVPPSPLP